MNTKKVKTLGQVYTPKWIIQEILHEVEYFGSSILGKYIIEPSCGDGAFLCEIIDRYICEAKKNHFSTDEIKSHLSKYIYGVEIDKNEYDKCINNLNKILQLHFSENIEVKWNIFNDDALKLLKTKPNFFDYVVGNPPYIRIHNLTIENREFIKKNFIFSQGMLDIYISFFEIGFHILKSGGKLSYITPNSFLNNSSYSAFRQYMKGKQELNSLINFKSFKVFQGFSTYTAISVFTKNQKQDFFTYKEIVENKIVPVNTIYFNDIKTDKWSFSDKSNSDFINLLFQNKNTELKDLFDIQYGFATLRDKIFIGNVSHTKGHLYLFNGFWVEKNILQKIVKASRYKGTENEIEYILFPYEKVGNRFVAISEEKLQTDYPYAYQYLLQNKEELEKRDMDKGAVWYEFGRSQGIQRVHKEKIVLNPLVNGSVIYNKVPDDVFVYSGIFITKKNELENWHILEDILQSDDFFRYIRIVGKDFSGGYKSITTKQLKDFRIHYHNQTKLF